MSSDILETVINWLVGVLIGLMGFAFTKLFKHDTQLGVLEKQQEDRREHLDQQLKDIKDSVTRMENHMLKKAK